MVRRPRPYRMGIIVGGRSPHPLTDLGAREFCQSTRLGSGLACGDLRPKDLPNSLGVQTLVQFRLQRRT